MNRVSDGDRSTLLSFVSCGASQGYAPRSGEIIGILTVLFRYVGIGTRLALTSMGWLTAREFVILVPDPIAFAPGPGETNSNDFGSNWRVRIRFSALQNCF